MNDQMITWILQVATVAAGTSAAAAAIWAGGQVQQGVSELLKQLEETHERSVENRERSRINRRLLVGDESTDGVIDRIEQVSEGGKSFASIRFNGSDLNDMESD